VCVAFVSARVVFVPYTYRTLHACNCTVWNHCIVEPLCSSLYSRSNPNKVAHVVPSSSMSQTRSISLSLSPTSSSIATGSKSSGIINRRRRCCRYWFCCCCCFPFESNRFQPIVKYSRQLVGEMQTPLCFLPFCKAEVVVAAACCCCCCCSHSRLCWFDSFGFFFPLEFCLELD